jgi:transposase InsO family protein
MKTDNGSAFIADTLAHFLKRWQVLSLFSPPRTPAYNGSIEASIGSLKTRCERRAVQLGHPGQWTGTIVEAGASRGQRHRPSSASARCHSRRGLAPPPSVEPTTT